MQGCSVDRKHRGEATHDKRMLFPSPLAATTPGTGMGVMVRDGWVEHPVWRTTRESVQDSYLQESSARFSAVPEPRECSIF